jgi:hypothetical protein
MLVEAARPISLGAINDRNREFWENQNSLRDTRTSNSVIFQTAIQDLKSEQLRQIPVYYRKTFEKALDDAAGTIARCDELSKDRFSRKGGRAPKADTLQKFIMDTVGERPRITEPQLLELLKETRRVFEVNAEEISFDKPNGAQKSVPLSALKDRLYRAKKKTNSR